MPIEYTRSRLAGLLMPYLDRFEVKRFANGSVTARDTASDVTITAGSPDELLLSIALECDWLDLGEHPTIDGVQILVSELVGARAEGWTWQVVDRNGRWILSPERFDERDAALQALNDTYDE
ncbi:MAG: hypothetical protein ACRER5_16210 [Pseudomonas sp.]